MSKKTFLPHGLVITKSGMLQYPRATPLDEDNPIDAVIPRVGDRIWSWSHTLRMSKKTVGTVVNVEAMPIGGGEVFHKSTIDALNGKQEEVWENVILTEDEFQEAKDFLG